MTARETPSTRTHTGRPNAAYFPRSATLARAGAILLALLSLVPSTHAANLTDPNVSAPGMTTGTTETWTFQFTTVSAVPTSGDVRVVFPAGFSVAAGTACDFTAPASVTAETTTRVSATEVVCNLGVADTIAAATPFTATISLVANPTTAQTTPAFTVETRTAADAVIDSHTTNTENIVASTLTGPPSVTAPTQTTGTLETHTITFTTVNAVAGSGDIRIVFPAGYDLNTVADAGADTACDVSAPGTVAGETTTVVSDTEVVCNLGGGDTIAGATPVTLTLTNVRNPTIVGATGAFTLQTRNNADALHDQHTTNTENIVASLLAALTVTAPAQTAGQTETHTVTFTTVNAVAGSGDIRIVFPAGYDLNTAGDAGADTACDVTAPGTVTAESTTVVSDTEVLCNLAVGDTVAGGTPVSLTLSNVRNPLTAGATGAFTVQTRNNADAVHDQHATNTENILAHAFAAGPTQASPDRETNAINTHTFTFTTFNEWEANGNLEITFPAGYAFNAGGAGTTVGAFTAGGSGTLAAPGIAGQTLTLLRQGGAIIPANTALTLTITQVRNPGASGLTGLFTIATSNNAAADHDSGTAAGVQITGGLASSVAATTVHVLEFGQVNNPADDCFYFDGQAPATPVAPTNFDIRITPCQGKAAGTLVADADTPEKNYAVGAGNTAPAVTLKYGDLNNNGRYDRGDYAYVGTGAATVLQLSNGPAQFTIRLTPAGSKAAGTHVFSGDSDFVSFQNSVRALTASVSWLDKDLSAAGELTTGDDAYLIPRAAGWTPNVLFPLASVRLSQGNPLGAYGSQVEASHADLLPQTNIGDSPDAAPTAGDLGLAAANIRAVPGTLRVAATGIYVDGDNSLTVTAGDARHVSYVPGLLAAVAAAGDSDLGVVLRAPDANFPAPVWADTNANAAIDLGENVYRTAAGGAGAALGANDRRFVSLARVLHVDLGLAGDLRDDCAYLDTDHTNTLTTHDLRLTPCLGNPAGSAVRDADTVERGVAPTAPAMKLVWADANANGRWEAADYAYLTTTGGAATTLAASTGPATHTLRLTPVGDLPAGTWVYAADADYQNHNPITASFAAAFVYFDADQGIAFTTGDRGYLQLASDYSLSHKVVALHAVRLTSGNAAGAFGSKVAAGQSDHLPTLGAASIVHTPVHVLDFGQAGDIRDDCVYLEMQGNAGAAAVAPSVYDLRITACQAKPAGTPVEDGDVAERNFAVGARNTAPVVTLKYADVNPNGRYDLGDVVYVGTGAGNALAASTGPAQFSIRLTATSDKAANTFVLAGDADFAPYSASVRELSGSIAWFDADRSANGAFTTGDTAYWLPRNAAGFAAGNVFPLAKIRAAGPVIAPAAPGLPAPSAPPGPTPPVDASVPSDPAAASSGPAPTGSGDASSPAPSPSPSRTPAPGAVAVLAAVALVGWAWRKRNA